VQDTQAYTRLVDASKQMEPDYANGVRDWGDSPFAWMLQLAPTTKGSIGVKLVTQLLRHAGLEVVKRTSSDHDMVANNWKVEVKLCLAWADDGQTYTFQQFRDQDWEFAVCLGLRANEAHCWVLTKSVVWSDRTDSHHARGEETKWIQGLNPDALGKWSWMSDYGGELSMAIERMKALLA
jgi:hypothetical protein